MSESERCFSRVVPFVSVSYFSWFCFLKYDSVGPVAYNYNNCLKVSSSSVQRITFELKVKRTIDLITFLIYVDVVSYVSLK